MVAKNLTFSWPQILKPVVSNLTAKTLLSNTVSISISGEPLVLGGPDFVNLALQSLSIRSQKRLAILLPGSMSQPALVSAIYLLLSSTLDRSSLASLLFGSTINLNRSENPFRAVLPPTARVLLSTPINPTLEVLKDLTLRGKHSLYLGDEYFSTSKYSPTKGWIPILGPSGEAKGPQLFLHSLDRLPAVPLGWDPHLHIIDLSAAFRELTIDRILDWAQKIECQRQILFALFLGQDSVKRLQDCGFLTWCWDCFAICQANSEYSSREIRISSKTIPFSMSSIAERFSRCGQLLSHTVVAPHHVEALSELRSYTLELQGSSGASPPEVTKHILMRLWSLSNFYWNLCVSYPLYLQVAKAGGRFALVPDRVKVELETIKTNLLHPKAFAGIFGQQRPNILRCLEKLESLFADEVPKYQLLRKILTEANAKRPITVICPTRALARAVILALDLAPETLRRTSVQVIAMRDLAPIGPVERVILTGPFAKNILLNIMTATGGTFEFLGYENAESTVIPRYFNNLTGALIQGLRGSHYRATIGEMERTLLYHLPASPDDSKCSPPAYASVSSGIRIEMVGAKEKQSPLLPVSDLFRLNLEPADNAYEDPEAVDTALFDDRANIDDDAERVIIHTEDGRVFTFRPSHVLDIFDSAHAEPEPFRCYAKDLQKGYVLIVQDNPYGVGIWETLVDRLHGLPAYAEQVANLNIWQAVKAAIRHQFIVIHHHGDFVTAFQFLKSHGLSVDTGTRLTAWLDMVSQGGPREDNDVRILCSVLDQPITAARIKLIIAALHWRRTGHQKLGKLIKAAIQEHIHHVIKRTDQIIKLDRDGELEFHMADVVDTLTFIRVKEVTIYKGARGDGNVQ